MDKRSEANEYIERAKKLFREDLRAKTWPEKVRASARLASARRSALAAMKKSAAKH